MSAHQSPLAISECLLRAPLVPGRQTVTPVNGRGFTGADVNVSFGDSFFFVKHESRGVAACVVALNGRWQSGRVGL